MIRARPVIICPVTQGMIGACINWHHIFSFILATFYNTLCTKNMPKYPEIFLPLGMVILLPLIRTIIGSLFRILLQALSCNERIMDFRVLLWRLPVEPSAHSSTFWALAFTSRNRENDVLRLTGRTSIKSSNIMESEF